MLENPIYYHLVTRGWRKPSWLAAGGATVLTPMMLLFGAPPLWLLGCPLLWICVISAAHNATRVAELWRQGHEDLWLTRLTPHEAVDAGLFRVLSQTIPFILLGALLCPVVVVAIPVVLVAYPNLLMLRLGRWPWWLPAGCVLYALCTDPTAGYLTVAFCAWLVWGSRAAAAAILARTAEPARPVAGKALNTNPWARAHSDNPVVVRETFREARGCGRTRVSLLAARHGGTILVTASVLCGGVFPTVDPCSCEWYGVLALVLLIPVQLFRSAFRAGTALSDERRQNTWTDLALTGLEPRNVVDGLAFVAYRWRLLESVVLSAVCAGVAAAGALAAQRLDTVDETPFPFPMPIFHDWNEGLSCLALLAACLWLAAPVGAYLGLLVASRGRSPDGPIVVAFLGAGGLLLIGWILLAQAGLPWVPICLAVLGPFCRWIAISQISNAKELA